MRKDVKSHKKAYHFWLCTQPKMQLLVFPLLLLTSLSKPISPITSSRSPHALFRPSILSLRGGSSPGDSFQSPPPPQHLYNANEYQNEHQHGVQQPAAESNPLLASATKLSVSGYFFLLVWRAVHLYELADQTRGFKRLCLVIPTVLMFLFDIAGLLVSFNFKDSNKVKLKMILNFNKAIELSCMSYSIFRLLLAPSVWTPREVYIGRVLVNFVMIMQSQLLTKVSWAFSSAGGGGSASSGSYDAYAAYEDQQQYQQNNYDPNNNNTY